MGTIISEEKLAVQKNVSLIIYCNNGSVFSNGAKDIGLEIANKLMKISERNRTLKIASIMSDIVKGYPSDTTFTGLDVLFNPCYQIDVLQLLINIRKQHNFRIIWPGTLADNHLIYSEEGYKDYARFDINKYDITCIM
ncbi:MAG: BREX-3 system P-loop-containing protein BrxF [Erysipelotrichaceae bacterium]|nr:BREX-3 system P-loop-containing protein BrxF [Erysipelotrichaceae bacterium]